MAITCYICNMEFPSDSAVKAHKRVAHQSETVVTLHDGTKVTVQRRECGEGQQGFCCPNSNCTMWSVNPNNLRKHCKRCYTNAVSDTEVDVAIDLQEFQDEASEAAPHSNLAQYGLVANPILCVLVCRKCQHAINPVPRHVRNHVKEKHAGQVPTLADLRAALEVDELRHDDDPMLLEYTAPGSELLVPIAGIKVQNGLKCQSCTYFCVTRESMRVHWHDHHAESRFGSACYTSCSVQTLFKGAVSINIHSWN
jgi:hypothetical protein